MYILTSESYCSKCHVMVKSVTARTLAFPELVGCPVICSRCLYESITGIKLNWNKHYRDLIEGDDLCHVIKVPRKKHK